MSVASDARSGPVTLQRRPSCTRATAGSPTTAIAPMVLAAGATTRMGEVAGGTSPGAVQIRAEAATQALLYAVP